MHIRQLFESQTSTYSYLLSDPKSREAVLIDPVRDMVGRDIALITELGLKLLYTLETHIHADHVTGAGALRQRLGCRTVVSRRSGVPCADVLVDDGDTIRFGRYSLEVRATPGHTEGCVSYVTDDHQNVFTGDTLLIGGCGRTDFQQGDARRLFSSVQSQLFTLPDSCVVHPGHDYHGRTHTTIGQERRENPRLREGRTEDEFVAIMEALHLAPPKQIDVAVPANLACGVHPSRTITELPAGPDALVGRVILDVREVDEFATGHIGGALNVPLGTHVETVARWERRRPLLMVCRSGRRSSRAAADLLQAGFSDVANLDGGMLAWEAAGLPVARG